MSAVAAPAHGRREQYTEQEIAAMATEELLALYKQTGQPELKWPVVLRYVGLIKSVARQVCGIYSNFAQLDDIVNEGVIALMGAVDKYDPEKGTKFETYVTKRIRGMVIDLARREDWMPRSVRRRSREIDEATNELYNSLGRFPTDQEMASRLGITQARYQEDLVKSSLSNMISLDALIEARERGQPGVAVPSAADGTQPEHLIQEQELRETLAEGIRSLREKEQLVLSLYYQKNLNMKEIAQVMEVSEPRISQIHTKAIQKLRIYLQKYMTNEQ